jgi:hypothetical protein
MGVDEFEAAGEERRIDTFLEGGAVPAEGLMSDLRWAANLLSEKTGPAQVIAFIRRICEE